MNKLSLLLLPMVLLHGAAVMAAPDSATQERIKNMTPENVSALKT